MYSAHISVANKMNFTSGGIRYSGRSDNSIASDAVCHWHWENFNVSARVLIPSKSKSQLKSAADTKFKDEVNPSFGIEIKMGGNF